VTVAGAVVLRAVAHLMEALITVREGIGYVRTEQEVQLASVRDLLECIEKESNLYAWCVWCGAMPTQVQFAY
jgi:hypothetical protein